MSQQTNVLISRCVHYSKSCQTSIIVPACIFCNTTNICSTSRHSVSRQITSFTHIFILFMTLVSGKLELKHNHGQQVRNFKRLGQRSTRWDDKTISVVEQRNEPGSFEIHLSPGQVIDNTLWWTGKLRSVFGVKKNACAQSTSEHAYTVYIGTMATHVQSQRSPWAQTLTVSTSRQRWSIYSTYRL